ncbi:LysR family transcriptional regulator [Psychromonas antarctica]|uniref:LysR family transcriptional regulator n=1 Tax=Psychromonas antarctica TaxID=67573 RepID=UPI001EE95E2B|nr:LysR family transcriptional regulator [Psychromonas antarctica]MCG6201702.1 LysR family transcriptional regulator [Psychromonas antarctica]
MHQEHKKLERLMLFSEVARHLSFTLAAASLQISRGHLSAQIRRLEKEMGLPLLIRSTRSVRLTAEGERVFTGTNKIRHSLLELERNAAHEGKTIEGLIKITAPSLFTERFLLDIFSKFRALHPAIEFLIDSSYTSYDLNSSNFDLAFRATNEPPLNMVARAILPYQHCCCASPAYLKKMGKPQTPADLKTHQCLRGHEQLTWPFLSANVAADGWLQINDNHMLKTLALRGEGIIRVPEYLVDQEINNGELVAILEDDMPKGLTIFMIYPQLIHQSKKLTAFIEFANDYF